MRTHFVTSSDDVVVAMTGNIASLGDWNYQEAMIGTEVPQGSGEKIRTDCASRGVKTKRRRANYIGSVIRIDRF